MTRKAFIQKNLAVALGLPFASLLFNGCEIDYLEELEVENNFSGKVIIIGAGAAGLAAAYFLQRQGVDFQIIEAGADFGGRVKRTGSFTDFPIDLGAEWIHASPSILAEILDDPSLDANINFVNYNPQTFRLAKDGTVKWVNYASNFYNEYKFKDTTWYGFFEQYIVPHFREKIVFNQAITTIDYTADKVVLETLNGATYEADKVLLTVPIKVLQNKMIDFSPALPANKSEAIDSIYVGDGLKAFIEFKEKFYPDILLVGDSLTSAFFVEEKTFYDAAFRKDTDKHVLGLFSINDGAAAYVNLGSDEAIINAILQELDDIFDGQASEHYVQHIIQNWTKEPYIRGAYSYTFPNGQVETVDTILSPLDNKVYFAGEALSVDYQATVHGACVSAYSVVKEILKNG